MEDYTTETKMFEVNTISICFIFKILLLQEYWDRNESLWTSFIYTPRLLMKQVENVTMFKVISMNMFYISLRYFYECVLSLRYLYKYVLSLRYLYEYVLSLSYLYKRFLSLRYDYSKTTPETGIEWSEELCVKRNLTPVKNLLIFNFAE